MKKILLYLSACMLLLASGCSEENEARYSHTVIVKELPKIYIAEIFEEGDTKIVQSKAELNGIFGEEKLLTMSDLNDIDFTKNTLLLGYTSNPYQVAYLHHSFTKTNDARYIYSVTLEQTATPTLDEFMYGIVIDKIAVDAAIVFDIR